MAGATRGGAVSVPGTCASHGSTPPRIQIKDVVTMARMVPVGIDFWASFRSPDRFEPAMMPAAEGRAGTYRASPGNTAPLATAHPKQSQDGGGQGLGHAVLERRELGKAVSPRGQG